MKIVIDVSEKAYNRFCQGYRFPDEVEEAIVAITDGTPLSKGHWIKVHPLQADDPGAYMCSCCKVGDWNLKGTEKFCPNCAAEMTEENKE